MILFHIEFSGGVVVVVVGVVVGVNNPLPYTYDVSTGGWVFGKQLVP